MRRVLIGLLVVAGCTSQDAADQAELRRHCLLPRDAPVVAWKGSTASGFGQREGLFVYGTFDVAATERSAFEKRAAEAKWPMLPISEEQRRLIEGLVRNDVLSTGAGLYSCRTAGDNILKTTKTSPCVSGPLHDIALCVYDRPRHEVFAAVRAQY